MTSKHILFGISIAALSLTSCVSKKKLAEAERTIAERDSLLQVKIQMLAACTDDKAKAQADLKTWDHLQRNKRRKTGTPREVVELDLKLNPKSTRVGLQKLKLKILEMRQIKSKP